MEFSERKSPRLQKYDYQNPNYYYVTICTAQKQCIFGEPGNLNNLGLIAERKLLEIPSFYEGVSVDSYVIMPNHLHCILIFRENSAKALPTLSNVIGSYKSGVSRQIHKVYPDLKVWQISFYDHIIRNFTGLNEIRQYILDNPRRWKEKHERGY